MDLYFIEFERIPKFVTVGNLETHQTDGKKKVEPQAYTVEFWRDSQGFVGHLPILRKQIEKGLVIDEITVFGTGKSVKITYETLLIEATKRVPTSKPKEFVCR